MELNKEQLMWFLEDTAANIGPADMQCEVSWLEAAIGTDNIIKDIPVLGFKSKNGYNYSKDAVKNAAALYEQVDVYLNHNRDSTTERKSEDKFGFLQNVRYVENEGLRGDLVANPKHHFFETFKWWAENHPNKLGLSHHAGGTFSKKDNEVTAITMVKSVDIVAAPATVSGLRESVLQEGVIEDSMNVERVLRRFKETVEKAVELIRTAQYDFQSSLATRAGGVAEVAKDLVAIMQEFNTANPQFDPNNTQEGEVMDWAKLNLSDLAKNRPDLVESISEDALVKSKAHEDKILESVKDVPEKLRTEFFLEQVRSAVSANNEELLAKIITDRKAIAPTTQKPTSGGVVQTVVTESVKVVETKDDFLKTLKVGGKK